MFGTTFSQLFPPRPTLTEENLPNQSGKVFIVTGGYAGVGYELSKILYRAGGKVYVAGRSESKARRRIDEIKAAVPAPASSGELVFLRVALDDLSTIPPAVRAFQAEESRLDVLWNNAGVSLPAPGSTSAQGHELQLATNCLGPFLLTALLLPTLQHTVSAHAGSPRVVWTSSQTVELNPPRRGFDLADITAPSADQVQNYVASKTGNCLLAAALARRGVASVVQNPGNLKTELLRAHPWLRLASAPLLHDARMGAYTELWAGLSAEVGAGQSGGYVIPWGRMHPGLPKDLEEAMKAKEDGGRGVADEFWAWCEEQTSQFR